MLSPGSSRTSHTRTYSFSNRSFWPTSPSSMPRSAAAWNPNSSTLALLLGRDNRDRVDLDQVVRRCHLGHFNHGRSGQRRLEVFSSNLVDRLEVLHVADVNVDTTHVAERASGSFHRRLDILADLARLLRDVADTGDAAVRLARRHPRNEDQLSRRFDHGRMGEDAARLPQFRAGDLGLSHCLFP